MNNPEFWHNKWAANQIGFHLEDVNPLLIEFWQTSPSYDKSVFVPLCGKSEDLIWLATKHEGDEGVELSQIAVRAFFAEHSLHADSDSNQWSILSIWWAECLHWWLLQLRPFSQSTSSFMIVLLVALPAEMRVQYVERLKQLLKPGKILLVALDYDQSRDGRPPRGNAAVRRSISCLLVIRSLYWIKISRD